MRQKKGGPRGAATAPLDPALFGGRAVAHEALGRVLGRGQVLAEALATEGLTDRDRAFAHLLATGTLRRLGQIDGLIAHCMERPLPKAAAPVMDILRLGAFQLVFLATPAHAAVDTAVDMTAALGFGGHRKLVNALLRRLAREGAEVAAAMDAPLLNTPPWLWRRWSDSFGAATCRAMAEVHLAEPPLDLSVKGDTVLWAERLGAEILPTGSLRLEVGGSVSHLPGYDEGAWWVQDAAAALPARLFPELKGKRVADLCAAPGGKTAQLAAAGAQVTALDRSAARLSRLSENLARLGLEAETVVADAARWQPQEPFDAVLLDAPCSATGTLRRHPDIGWTKTATDIARMAKTQETLLNAALGLVKPGGVLVYCTCSLETEEGEQRVGALLGAGAPVRRLPIAAAEVGGLAETLTEQGDLRSLPCHLGQKGGMDGFYAARLVKE